MIEAKADQLRSTTRQLPMLQSRDVVLARFSMLHIPALNLRKMLCRNWMEHRASALHHSMVGSAQLRVAMQSARMATLQRTRRMGCHVSSFQ